VKGAFLVLFKGGDQLVALRQVQASFLQSGLQDTKVVDLLVDARTLSTREGQGCARFIRNEGAAARRNRFQWTLKEQAVFQILSGLFCKQGRVQIGLFGPQSIKFVLDHGSVNVEVVAFLYA